MDVLRDLRVLDFSTEIAGPYATELLADAGADVVKVEEPAGDPLRRRGADGGENSALFRFLNAQKRSVVATLGSAEIEELVAGADVVVESWPDPSAGRTLAHRRPGLVVVSHRVP